jgi:chromosome segregation ATPase
MSQSFEPDWTRNEQQTGKDSIGNENDGKLSEKVRKLEEQLREERERHQNDIVALQEALTIQQATRQEESHTETNEKLLSRWHDASKDDPEELERIFKDSLRLAGQSKQESDTDVAKDPSSRATEKDFDDSSKTTELATKVDELDSIIEDLQAKLDFEMKEKEDLKEKLSLLEENQKNTSEKSVDESDALKRSLKEEQERCSDLAKEVDMMEDLIAKMKDEKEIMRKEKEASDAVIEELQTHQNDLKSNLLELEKALNEQIAHDKELSEQIKEYESMIKEQKQNMSESSKLSEEYEQSLANLKSQLNALQNENPQLENLTVRVTDTDYKLILTQNGFF